MSQILNQDAAAAVDFMKRTGSNVREDAGLWIARQLEYVRTRGYEEPQIVNPLVNAIPRSSDIPEWAETFTYPVYDEVGIAKIIANYADDLPRVDIAATEVTAKIQPVGVSYGYNTQELTVSNAMGSNLPTRKAVVARKATDRKIEDLTMVGEARHGVTGIVNHPNIGVTVLPTSTAWSAVATTADAIMADVNALMNALALQSSGVHMATHFFMPLTAYTAMNSKRNTTTGYTALTMAREAYPSVTFVGVPQLEATKQVIVGEFTSTNIESIVPQPFKQLPAQERNLEFVIPCTARAGGVSVYQPLAFTRATLV